jgi:DNA polymerase elongation subunit (family B)
MSYKNCYVQRGDEWNQYRVHLWTDQGYTVEDFQNYGYIECSSQQSTHKGLKGENLKKIFNWQKDNPQMHYSDHYRDNIHTKFLIDKYGDDDTPSVTHREVFFDIEIEMGGALTPEYIKQAPKPVTSIAWWDRQLDDWRIVILDKENKLEHTIDSQGREVIPVNRETDLLDIFIRSMEEIQPDILVGYNSDYFDIPYLYYRIKNAMGERTAKRLSPINIIEERDRDEDMPIKIAGVTSLDYMRLHKKYSFKDEPSYKLGALGEKYVNQKKIEYHGSLDRLFAEDKEKFIEYNFVDILILKKLDEKFKYIDLTKNLAHKGKIMYEEVYQSSRIHDGAISSWLISQGIIPPNKDLNPTTKENYAGGYLFCPKTGIYKYMFDEDLTSLYPSIIMSLNIGKETYVGRVLDLFDDRNNRLGLNDLETMVAENAEKKLPVESPQGNQQYMLVKDIIDKIKTHNLAITANGVMFRTDKKSVLSIILDKWFDERVMYKKAMKKAYKNGNKKEEELNHLKQYTMKILLNSLYGATALASFRYGNVILSEGITLTGQRIIQESALFANTHMNKVLRGEINLEL